MKKSLALECVVRAVATLREKKKQVNATALSSTVAICQMANQFADYMEDRILRLLEKFLDIRVE